MKTTFKRLKDFHPCENMWKKLNEYWLPKSMAAEITIKQILESNGIKTAIWALRAVDNKKKVALFCIEIAESVLPIFEKRFKNDKRPRRAIKASRNYLYGRITLEELQTASAAALYASCASDTLTFYADSEAAVTAAYTSTFAAYAFTDAPFDTVYASVPSDIVEAATDADTRKEKWKEIEKMLIKYLK